MENQNPDNWRKLIHDNDKFLFQESCYYETYPLEISKIKYEINVQKIIHEAFGKILLYWQMEIYTQPLIQGPNSKPTRQQRSASSRSNPLHYQGHSCQVSMFTIERLGNLYLMLETLKSNKSALLDNMGW